ncbi:hypothetical protein ACM66B_001014 [Microbotryomycetes sp. NB124-2]
MTAELQNEQSGLCTLRRGLSQSKTRRQKLKRVSGNVEAHSLSLCRLPVEVVMLFACYLDPQDLLNMSKLSKSWHATMTNRALDRCWIAARKAAGWPELSLPFATEERYARFMHAKACQFCNYANEQNLIRSNTFRVVACRSCFSERAPLFSHVKNTLCHGLLKEISVSESTLEMALTSANPSVLRVPPARDVPAMPVPAHANALADPATKIVWMPHLEKVLIEVIPKADRPKQSSPPESSSSNQESWIRKRLRKLVTSTSIFNGKAWYTHPLVDSAVPLEHEDWPSLKIELLRLAAAESVSQNRQLFDASLHSQSLAFAKIVLRRPETLASPLSQYMQYKIACWPEFQQAARSKMDVNSFESLLAPALARQVVEQQERYIITLHEKVVLARSTLAARIGPESLADVVSKGVPGLDTSTFSQSHTLSDCKQLLNLPSVVIHYACAQACPENDCICRDGAVSWHYAAASPEYGNDYVVAKDAMLGWWSVLKLTGLEEDTPDLRSRLLEFGRSFICNVCVEEAGMFVEPEDEIDVTIQAYTSEELIRHLHRHWSSTEPRLFDIRRIEPEETHLTNERGERIQILRHELPDGFGFDDEDDDDLMI